MHMYDYMTNNSSVKVVWFNPVLLWQEFIQSCVRTEAKTRPTAHDLLFHRVLFEVHSLKLLAAHCFINNQCKSMWKALFIPYILRSGLIMILDLSKWRISVALYFEFSLKYLFSCLDLLPENCVEEKTKSYDPNGIMAEINHRDRPGVHLKWVSQSPIHFFSNCFFLHQSLILYCVVVVFLRYSHVSPLELDKFLEDVKWVMEKICWC